MVRHYSQCLLGFRANGPFFLTRFLTQIAKPCALQPSHGLARAALPSFLFHGGAAHPYSGEAESRIARRLVVPGEAASANEVSPALYLRPG